MTQSEMTSRLIALCFDANDPLRLARFWAVALHWDMDDETHDEVGLVPTDDTRFRILFLPVPEEKAGKNRIHLDLTSTSIDDQKKTVGRLVEIGQQVWPLEQVGAIPGDHFRPRAIRADLERVGPLTPRQSPTWNRAADVDVARLGPHIHHDCGHGLLRARR
jgi:Glyoxalase-like domain